jgi:hypothetical protein
MGFDWQIRIPGPSVPTVPIRVLGRDYLAWEWKDVPEEQRKEIVFARLEDDLQVHAEHLAKLRVLNRQDSERIMFQVRELNAYETLTCIKSVEVKYTNPIKVEEREIREWLYGLGIPFQTPIIVMPTFGGIIVVSTWKMVVRYFDTWEWLSDHMVFDEKYTWAVHFDHNDWISFYSRNPKASTTPDQLE